MFIKIRNTNNRSTANTNDF